MDSTAFYNILIFLLAAVIIVPLFRQLRSSPVLGYLAAGLLIGPFGLRLIEDSHSIHVLAEFGVVFLLFKIGLELSLERLKVLRRYVFGLGVMQVASCGLIIGLIAYFLGVSPGAAIIIGGGFALSSTAFQAPAGLAAPARAGAVSMMDLEGLKAQAKEVASMGSSRDAALCRFGRQNRRG